MRRLTTRTRNDFYLSRRDYQHLRERVGQRVLPMDGGATIVFRSDASQGMSAFVGAGGFVRTSGRVAVEFVLVVGDREQRLRMDVGTHWCRFGIVVEDAHAADVELELSWTSEADVDLWGIDGGRLTLPAALSSATELELSPTHLAPETFYLPHASAIGMDVVSERSSFRDIVPGAPIALKKCAYDGRSLPVDQARLGSLSFHKHNSKATLHQNECRACKKWRINDTLNELRTPVQLHESSLLTRERKIFLREPAILKRLKDRLGAGLKSIVWERFGRKCFYCDRPLALHEVQLDHTRPLAYLWPIDEHATCLCAMHNNQKQDKFPVDFYSEDQLHRLSELVGLAYDELVVRDVCDYELRCILSDLPTFAREWTPRTFAATARKVREVRPEVDMFALLGDEDPELREGLEAELRERPGDEDEVDG